MASGGKLRIIIKYQERGVGKVLRFSQRASIFGERKPNKLAFVAGIPRLWKFY